MFKAENNIEFAELLRLWKVIEDIINLENHGCKNTGGCDASCCNFDLSEMCPTVMRVEVDIIKQYLRDHLIKLPVNNIHKCRFLDAEGKCLIYEVRPTQCRLHFCKNNNYESINSLNIEKKVYEYSANHIEEWSSSDYLRTIDFSS